MELNESDDRNPPELCFFAPSHKTNTLRHINVILSMCHLNFYFIWNITRFLELLFEVLVLPLVISAVGHSLASDLGIGNTRVLPLSHSTIVVDEEDSPVRVNSLFPTFGKRQQIIVVSPIWNIALKMEQSCLSCDFY